MITKYAPLQRMKEFRSYQPTSSLLIQIVENDSSNYPYKTNHQNVILIESINFVKVFFCLPLQICTLFIYFGLFLFLNWHKRFMILTSIFTRLYCHGDKVILQTVVFVNKLIRLHLLTEQDFYDEMIKIKKRLCFVFVWDKYIISL